MFKNLLCFSNVCLHLLNSLKHILALPKLGQICTVSELQPFTYVMFQTEHPVFSLYRQWLHITTVNILQFCIWLPHTFLHLIRKVLSSRIFRTKFNLFLCNFMSTFVLLKCIYWNLPCIKTYFLSLST